MEQIIQRDLDKHRSLLSAARGDLAAFRTARAHEIQKKRHYSKLIGGGKFNDHSLRVARGQMNINIRHMSDKADTAERSIAHETEIVDTLAMQLKNQMAGLVRLAEHRRENGDAAAN
ncbi:MAG: hypothetical protein QNL26_02910 [Acidimicrobiia bacterium]|nr:hypothetical protein [Acidimicrobiia bacterium]